MAKKPTAAKLARKKRKQEKRKETFATRPDPEQARAEMARRHQARDWHAVAAHEIGHSLIETLLGLPIKEVTCRPYQNLRGFSKPAVERRAYAKRAMELSPACAVCVATAGAAGTRVAGFSAATANRGTELDRDSARLFVMFATGKARIIETDSTIGRYQSDGGDDENQLDEQLWQRACTIAEQVLRKEKVAFTALVEELRYSPRGWMRGGRVGEVLFSHGVDVSGTRDWLVREATELDKRIGTIAGRTYSGLTAQHWEHWSRLLRDRRNATDRLRRAKKKR